MGRAFTRVGQLDVTNVVRGGVSVVLVGKLRRVLNVSAKRSLSTCHHRVGLGEQRRGLRLKLSVESKVFGLEKRVLWFVKGTNIPMRASLTPSWTFSWVLNALKASESAPQAQMLTAVVVLFVVWP